MSIRYFIVLMLFIGFKTASAQDLIVTKKGDSLNCRITKIKSDYIYFTFKYENEFRSTLYPVELIKFYKKDFYSNAEVPIEEVKNNGKYQKANIAIHGGWSYIIAKVSDKVPADFVQYVKDLKSGYHFGCDAGYFISENIGFGLKYLNFKTQNKLDNIMVTDLKTGQSRFGSLKDDITIQYIGPTLYSRFYSFSKKTIFVSNFSIGYINYRNNATVVDNFILTSNTVAGIFDFGVDLLLTKSLAFGLGLSLTFATLDEYERDDGITTQTINLKNEDKENISRLDLSIGLRWNL